MNATLPNNASGMKGLSSDMVAELMANSRGRNQYGPKLLAFAESDEAAINPAEVWPLDFAGKKATTLYQGFRLAAEKAGLGAPDGPILIKQSDDNVFLLHNDRVSVMLNPEATDDSENS